MPAIPTVTVKPGYRPQAPDTSLEADVLLFRLLGELTPLVKAERVQRLDRTIRHISPLNAVIEDPISLALRVAARLEALGIAYYVGGSLASSLLGEPRYSEDLDLVLAIDLGQVQPFITAFDRDFYISEVAILEAVQRGSGSFNLIHLESAEKVDCFVTGAEPFARAKLGRRVQREVPGGMLWVATAEDMVLQKLLWRRDNQSEKQWRDVLGVVKVQGERLDFEYLGRWAIALDLTADLVEVLTQAGL